MKYNCVFCKQDINDKGGSYYDWRDTRCWIIKCSNCGAKLKPSSLSTNERQLRTLFEIFWLFVVILCVFTWFSAPDSKLGQYRTEISILVFACPIIHLLIVSLWNNKEVKTSVLRQPKA